MAVRDRNMFAWQAYVITMTFVSVGLLMSLGFVLFTGSTNRKQALDAKTQANDLEKKLNDENFKMQYMLHMLGAKQSTEQEVAQLVQSIAGNAEMETLKKAYESDMSLFGPEVPPQDRSYSKLVSHLMSVVRRRNSDNDKAAKELERLTKEVESIRTQETKARQAADADRERLTKELADARTDYSAKEGELLKQIEDLNNSKKLVADESARRENALKAKNKELADLNAGLLKFKAQVIEDIAKNTEREDFESAQGKVVSIDQNIVFVNLGRKDGLRQGLTFSVLNADTLRVSDATPKARITITSVDETVSQGKIEPSRRNVPVIPDDLVYSPTWKSGGKVNFALMGVLDIDGDGKDDRNLVKTIIERNGGMVVDDIGPEPKAGEGTKMDIYTRYLVVGELPKSLATAAQDPKATETASRYAKARTKARELNISEMSLEKLIGYLKKYDDDRTVGLGDAIRSEDFKDRSGPLRSTMDSSRDFGLRPSGPLSGAGAK